jgi:hypothetical protein
MVQHHSVRAAPADDLQRTPILDGIRVFWIVFGLFALGLAIGWFVVNDRAVVRAKRVNEAIWYGEVRQVAERDLAAAGYQVIALDRTPRIDCKWGAYGFEFTAVRGGNLIGGGICASTDPTVGSVIVALPPLR